MNKLFLHNFISINLKEAVLKILAVVCVPRSLENMYKTHYIYSSDDKGLSAAMYQKS